MKVPGKRRMKELSLEEYAVFQAKLDDPFNLTSDQLNQVLSMHGFCKLYRAKAEMLEALSSVPLVSPFRSTLALGACPAPLTADDVSTHVADLDWRECPMVAIRTFRPCSEADVPSSPPPPLLLLQEQMKGSPVKCQSSSSNLRPRLKKLAFPKKKKKKKKKKKRAKRVELSEEAELQMPIATVAASNNNLILSTSMVDDGLDLTL